MSMAPPPAACAAYAPQHVGEIMATRRILLSLVLALAVLAPAGLAAAQDLPPIDEADGPDVGDATKMNVPELWQQLLYYVRTANADAARSFATALLERDPSPTLMYQLSLRPPTVMTELSRGMHLRGMEEPIQQIRDLIEKGYQQQKADPDRIREAIEMLGGGLESYNMGRERLLESGEYAVPYLIQELMTPEVPDTLRARIVNIFPDMGKEAVRPLSAALQTSDANLQKVFADALGQIEYPHALPRLKELHEREELLPAVQSAVERAIIACGGKTALGKPAAELYYDYAKHYYYRAESLRPDPRSSTANIWRWREGLGLVHVAVPRQVFCDVYAKRMARLALAHNDEYYAAVPMWLSAAFNEEANLPAGQLNPLRGPEQPSAQFYALASSPEYLQDVISRALDDENTPVALAALKSLVRIIGTDRIFDARPLVASMTYPDREVRFFAAVSLAKAQPSVRFAGYQMVMPVLSGALRQPGSKVALLVCEDLEQRNLLKAQLRDAGYTVVEDEDVGKAMAKAQPYAGADVAVVGARPAAKRVLDAVRSDPRYVRLPLVVANESPSIDELTQDDETVASVANEPDAEDLDAAVTRTIRASVGRPLSPDEADRWAVAAAEAVQALGRSDSKIYDLSYVLPALSQALGSDSAAVRKAAAHALGAIDNTTAQQDLAEFANDGAVPEEVRLAAYAALGSSMRHYGNSLTEKQIDGVRSVATDGAESHPIRMAAAEAFGAMGLASEDIVPIIQGTAGTD